MKLLKQNINLPPPQGVIAENGAFYSVWAIAVKGSAIVGAEVATASPYAGQLSKFIVGDDPHETVFVGGCSLDSNFGPHDQWGLPWAIAALFAFPGKKIRDDVPMSHSLKWVRENIEDCVLRNALRSFLRKEYKRVEIAL